MNRMWMGSVLVVVVAAAGCGPANKQAQVTVQYEQIANFATYLRDDGSSTTTGPGPDGLYVMYRIKRISNTGSAAAPFTFRASDVVIATGTHTTNEQPSGENILLGGQLASPVEVAPGRTLAPAKGIGCIIKIARHTDPRTLIGKMLDLFHTIDPKQPVNMTRTPGNTSESAVVGAASPSVLQQLCNT